ncbi:MAG: helix-turn-helix transcriptional regulator [Polyangiaceae bacterium]|nr:helix-turn-helix transcriptional regulator [Polyangiaceae bacterium]
MGVEGTRGILNPALGFEHFSLERAPTPADLAPFLDAFWSVRWDLDGRPPYEQEILPYPCVNLSFDGRRFEVHGPSTQRFVARLSGRGSVHGTKFSPAGFHAFASVPLRSLVDRVVSVEEATGLALPSPDGTDAESTRSMVIEFLRRAEPRDEPDAALANRLVVLAQSDRTVCCAEDLATKAGLSVRSLHRLFERYVGVGPKWVVRRARVQEAADKVARGELADWVSIALELGYHDQSHFIRDFRAQVGFTPAAYARRCAARV